MPKFILNDNNEREFRELPAFVRGYIEAMFFTEECTDVTIEEFRTPEFQERLREGEVSGSIPGETGFLDIHPDSLERIVADCGAFRVRAGALLDEAYTRVEPAKVGGFTSNAHPEYDYDAECAGRDFWFTRNGHGVGFWSRLALEAGELGERLSVISRDFGEVQIWFADHVTYGDAPFVHYQ